LKVRFLDLGVERFLWIGKKRFMIPVDAVADTSRNWVIIDHSREDVISAPDFHSYIPPLGPRLQSLRIWGLLSTR
jgi:hypothetical protein